MTTYEAISLIFLAMTFVIALISLVIQIVKFFLERK